MACTGRLLLVLFLSLLLIFGVATAASPAQWVRQRGRDGGDVAGQEAPSDHKDAASFSALVDDISPESLHDLLHKYFPRRFRHGIWPSERSAIKALHQDDAALATSIAQMARRDNNNNTTTTSVTPATTTSTTSSSTSDETTTSHSDASTTPTTTSTSLTSSTFSTTSSSFTPTSSTTSSNTPSTTSTLVSSLTTTSLTTSSTTSSSRDITTTFTSTDSTGGVVVVTDTTFVGAASSTQTTGASTTLPSGTLQTNAALPRYRRAGDILEAVAAGVAIGGILLV